MSSSTNRKYDVFISFRGEDTRKSFTHNLRLALDQAGIKTYTDVNLVKGEGVWSSLSEAIQGSDIAIVVFSKNYATSKWCLKELVKILECRKDENHKLVVIPVFYEVDPTHIRNQTGSYRKAFAKYERDLLKNGGDKEKDNVSMPVEVNEWKMALTEAGKISGWHSCNYESDSECIEKIVQDVLTKQAQMHPNELEVKRFVRIDKICEHIQLLLSRSKEGQLLKNVRIIGIWGMGGIGKTTIAKAVFANLFPGYDSVCFMENIREWSKNSLPNNSTSLCNKLLSELLKEENLNLFKFEAITKRLSSKKVFVVLDDVDSSKQLDELLRKCYDAAPDSKIIITTRNRHLLDGKVDEIYKAKTWIFDDSLKLFCLHAFNQLVPEEGYQHLSEEAVKYVGGVPLALEVLGSNLRSRDADFWREELQKIKKYPYDGIQNVLRVSYDGLDSTQQKIFLDIAFFFKDENKDFVGRILRAFDFFPRSGLVVLEDKALITISKDMRIRMHDLLQEMGLNIVRQGIEDPGKRSRLKDVQEIYDVLAYEKGTDAVEGMKLDLSRVDKLLSFSANAFDMMTMLRYLKMYIPTNKRLGNVDYPKVLNKISNELRFLEWHGYPLKSLPETFNGASVVEIRIPYSDVTELWQGVKYVVNLEGIDLSECKHLTELPDLSKARKLKWLNLTGCGSLLALHPSILSLDTLETLTLDGCENLKNLVSEKHLSSLQNLSVNGCTSLEEFSMSSDLIEKLDLSKTGIKKLHSSIGTLTGLMSLNLQGLKLENLPNELSSLKNLMDLKISNCTSVLHKEKLHVLFEGLTNLRILHLKDCPNLPELPDNISNLSQLYDLTLDGSNVNRLPKSIKHLEYLEILSLNNCSELWYLPALPLDVSIFNAANCRSLAVVATLKTFAGLMRGKEKFVSFKNCSKIKEKSLQRIMEGIELTMMSALFQNKFVASFGLKTHSYNYNLVKVCLPGSRVPSQFTCRTTKSLFAVMLPAAYKLVGLIFCVVLSKSEELLLKKQGARIWCQCYWDSGIKLGYATTFHHQGITDLESDHVYMWCDSFHFDSIFEGFGDEVVSFHFYVTNDDEEPEVLNISPKECGVHLVFDSRDMHVPLRRVYSELSKGFNLDVDLNIRSLLGFEVESEHAETTTLTGIECFDDEDGEVRSGDDDERERERERESGEVRRSDDAEREREGGEGRSDAERDLFGLDILNIFKKIVEGTGRRIKLPNK